MHATIWRTTFLESEIYEGDYHGAPSTVTREIVYGDTFPFHAIDMFQVCREWGLTFEATGSDRAANPDGSVIVNHDIGLREEVTFCFGDDVPERIQRAVMAAVDTGKV